MGLASITRQVTLLAAFFHGASNLIGGFSVSSSLLVLLSHCHLGTLVLGVLGRWLHLE
jgi:hypothetical protein